MNQMKNDNGVRIVTDFRVLMKLAKELGDARKSGDESRIKQAKLAHDEYRDLCLSSDEMVTGLTYKDMR